MKINEIIQEGAISPQTWNSLTPQQKQEISGYINDLTGTGNAGKYIQPKTTATDYVGDVAGAIAGQSGATSMFKQAKAPTIPSAPVNAKVQTNSGIYTKTNQGWSDANNRIANATISQTLDKKWYTDYQNKLKQQTPIRQPTTTVKTPKSTTPKVVPTQTATAATMPPPTAQPTVQTATSATMTPTTAAAAIPKIALAKNPGAPTPQEYANLQAKLQAALKSQQGQQ